MSILFRRKKAELALLYALPVTYQGEKNSRLYNLQKRLQKIVVPYIRKVTQTPSQAYGAVEDIFKWGIEIGWLKDNKPTGSLVSFCIQMVEDSPIDYDPRIMETLQLMAAHLDDGGLLQEALCIDGCHAVEKWQELFQMAEMAEITA